MVAAAEIPTQCQGQGNLRKGVYCAAFHVQLNYLVSYHDQEYASILCTRVVYVNV